MPYVRFDASNTTRFSETSHSNASEFAAAMPGATNVVVQAAPFLESEKVRAISHANSWRLSKETGGFTYSGKTFQSDALSSQRIMGAVMLAQSNPASSQVWTAADNSTVTLDQAGIIGLFQALGAHVATTFATAKAAKSAINAATTVEQIEAALETLT